MSDEKHYHTSTPEQQAKHSGNAETFCANVEVLLDLAANHKEQRVRYAAIRAISSFALLKADPAGADCLCGPKVKQAIDSAVRMIGQQSTSEFAN